MWNNDHSGKRGLTHPLNTWPLTFWHLNPFWNFAYPPVNYNFGSSEKRAVCILLLASRCSGYHYCTTSFIKACTQVLHRFKSYSRHVGDSRWWGSLTIVPAEAKAKRFSLINHTTKTIHYHHWHPSKTYIVKHRLCVTYVIKIFKEIRKFQLFTGSPLLFENSLFCHFLVAPSPLK